MDDDRIVFGQVLTPEGERTPLISPYDRKQRDKAWNDNVRRTG